MWNYLHNFISMIRYSKSVLISDSSLSNAPLLSLVLNIWLVISIVLDAAYYSFTIGVHHSSSMIKNSSFFMILRFSSVFCASLHFIHVLFVVIREFR